MGEYLFLAIFVAVLATTTVWTVRILKIVGRTCYQASLPGNEESFSKLFKKVRDDANLPTLSEDLKSLPMPWGWKMLRRRKLKPKPVRRVKPAETSRVAPWGWPGHAVNGGGDGLNLLTMLVQKPGNPAVDIASGSYPGERRAELSGAEQKNISGDHPSERPAGAGKIGLKVARSPWGW